MKKNGFSLIEVLVAVGISAIVIAASTAALQSHLQTKAQEHTRANLIQLKQQILSAIRNPNSWQETRAQNSSDFSCLESECTQADHDTPKAIALFSGPGALLVPEVPSLATGAEGWFTSNGQICTAFPSANCIVRIQILWRPLCKSYPCRGEVAQDALDIVFKFSDSLPHFSSQSLTMYNYLRVTKTTGTANECDSLGMIYAPYGFTRSDGLFVAADSNGCIDDDAVVPTPTPPPP